MVVCISPEFPLASQLYLPASAPISYIPESSHVCTHLLSQGGLHQRGLRVAWHQWAALPFRPPRSFLSTCSRGGCWALRMRNRWPLSSTPAGPRLFSQLPCHSCLRVLLRRGQISNHFILGVGGGMDLLPHNCVGKPAFKRFM